MNKINLSSAVDSKWVMGERLVHFKRLIRNAGRIAEGLRNWIPFGSSLITLWGWERWKLGIKIIVFERPYSISVLTYAASWGEHKNVTPAYALKGAVGDIVQERWARLWTRREGHGIKAVVGAIKAEDYKPIEISGSNLWSVTYF